ncbi:hypothetical protein MFLO_05100 [Listeria floridensis FSL S10-1187]|uniref:YpoC-like domain-containing protein n=1 Tax=Listeria floridensis FSL S10-1187 TaxID=1265817 RepID=A0ABP3B144_9LIST|nr:hypothetical protein MFLO_05100 [Listeria floridensis FSL S10-1187]
MVKFQYVNQLEHQAFPAPHVEISELDRESIFVSGLPFWQEQLFYSENGGVKPWETNAAKACRKLSKHMTAILENLDAVLRAHEKPNPALVKDALGIFLSVLFWSNGRPVELNRLEEAINELEAKPLNCYDRLSYALKRGNTFFGISRVE